ALLGEPSELDLGDAPACRLHQECVCIRGRGRVLRFGRHAGGREHDERSPQDRAEDSGHRVSSLSHRVVQSTCPDTITVWRFAWNYGTFVPTASAVRSWRASPTTARATRESRQRSRDPGRFVPSSVSRGLTSFPDVHGLELALEVMHHFARLLDVLRSGAFLLL